MLMFFRILGAFIAVGAFCFLWLVPKKFILPASLVGAAGCWVYLFVTGLGYSAEIATFLAGCLICVCGQLLARRLRTPVTEFVIPGILPLVPGAGMYNIVASIIMPGEMAYSTAYYFTDTLCIAGMIAVSIIVVDSFFHAIRYIERTFKKA